MGPPPMGNDVDWKTVALVALSLLDLVIGWFVRIMWEALQELRKDHKELPETYVRRDDIREWKSEVLEFLRRIEAKIDTKADKH